MRAGSSPDSPSPTRAPSLWLLVLHWLRSHEQGRAPRIRVAAGYPARAKLHRIGCVPPFRPSTSASAGVTSKSGRARTGRGRRPTSARSSRPNATKIFAPQGRTECPTPSVFGLSSVPHPDAWPASGRERTPARAVYQPLTLGDCRLWRAAARPRPRRRETPLPARPLPRAAPAASTASCRCARTAAHSATASSSEAAPRTRVYASTSSDGAPPRPHAADTRARPPRAARPILARLRRRRRDDDRPRL